MIKNNVKTIVAFTTGVIGGFVTTRIVKNIKSKRQEKNAK